MILSQVRLLVLLSVFVSTYTSAETLEHYLPKGKPHLMAALGDSITAGARSDSSALGESAPEAPSGSRDSRFLYNWSTGELVNSHRERLAKLLGAAPLEYLNLAVSGIKIDKLSDQVQKLLQEYATGKYESLDYVTLLIGNNDACVSTPLDEMRVSLVKALEQIAGIGQRKPIAVLISYLPKMPDLGKPEISETRTQGGLISCHTLRDTLMMMCRHMTDWDGDDEYRARVAEIDSINQVFESVGAELSKKYPQLKIEVSKALYEHHIEPNELAFDCFHPNFRGHALISEALWDERLFSSILK